LPGFIGLVPPPALDKMAILIQLSFETNLPEIKKSVKWRFPVRLPCIYINEVHFGLDKNDKPGLYLSRPPGAKAPENRTLRGEPDMEGDHPRTSCHRVILIAEGYSDRGSHALSGFAG
jgi:hypothetical protein